MSSLMSGLSHGSSLSEGIFLNPDPLGLDPVPEDTRQRFLQFQICGGEVALLPLMDIAAVLQLTIAELLPIPDVSPWLLGVCNWRGEMLWLADTNSLLGKTSLWSQTPMVKDAMIIVIQADGQSVGLAVEQVDDVALIAAERIIQPENFDSVAVDSLVMGHLANHGGRILNAAYLIRKSFQSLS